jgi:hypothetical protein
VEPALFIGVAGVSAEQDPSTPLAAWLWVLFPVLFAGMWLLVSHSLAAMGGWRALAEVYPARSPFTGTRFRLRSARLGGHVNYNSCLTLGAGPAGLYLAVLPMFLVAHPPLLIPWSDITARETRSWLLRDVELRFARVPGTTLRTSRRLAQALFDASGTSVLVQRSE